MSGAPQEAPTAHALAQRMEADGPLASMTDEEKGLIVSVIEKAWMQAPGDDLIELRLELIDELDRKGV